MPSGVCFSNYWFLLVPQDWYNVCETYKPNDTQWALKTKAILERLQIILADRSDCFQKMVQPSVQYLGNLLGVGKWAVCSTFHLCWKKINRIPIDM